MKKIIVLILVIMILSFSLLSGQDEIIKEVRQLYNQKNFAEALKVIEKGLAELKDNSQLIKWKFYTLMKLKRYDDALAHIEKNVTDPSELAGAKFLIFKQQGKYEQALEMALEKEKNSKRKSPWGCFDLIELYIKLNKTEKALDWLDEAINRGFISFMFLFQDDFAPIQNEDRFKKAVATIKAKIGIDQMAKDFSVTLLNGETFTLSGQKGKVVLIDFWATWCGPCMRALPHINEIGRDYGHDGDLFIIAGNTWERSVGEERLAAVAAKWTELGMTIPYYLDAERGADGPHAVDEFGVTGIPSTFLLGPGGKLLFRKTGMGGEADVLDLRQKIDYALSLIPES